MRRPWRGETEKLPRSAAGLLLCFQIKMGSGIEAQILASHPLPTWIHPQAIFLLSGSKGAIIEMRIFQ
jgi:hypothetical protein